MRKNIFIILLLTVFLMLNIEAKALTYGGCEYSQISRLKSIVSNVNISYDYYVHNSSAYFNITLSNLVPEIYFVDTKNDKTYTYSDTKNGEIVIYGNKYTDGSYKFYSALASCRGIKLGTKYYKLPRYNIYHDNKICEGIENYSLCKKWANISYSYYELENLINKYKNGENDEKVEENQTVIYEKSIVDYIVEFYIKNYYFILLGIILICIIIMIINRKRNKFDL